MKTHSQSPEDIEDGRLWVVEHHCLHALRCTEAGRGLEVKSVGSQIRFLKSTAILGKSLHLFASFSSSAKGKQPSCPPVPKVCSGGFMRSPCTTASLTRVTVVPASRPPVQLMLRGIPPYCTPSAEPSSVSAE